MADPKFKIVTKDFQSDLIFGVRKDTFISDLNKTSNYGASSFFGVGTYRFAPTVRDFQNSVLEIRMPEKKDIDGFDIIIKIELILTLASKSFREYVSGAWVDRPLWWLDICAVEIPDIFDEGSGMGTPGWCNWDERIMSVGWERGGGAITSTFGNYDNGDGFIYDTERFNLASVIDSEFKLDLSENFSFGNIKRFVIFGLKYNGDISGAVSSDLAVSFHSKEATGAHLTKRPILRITYRDYSVEAFTDKDSALTIEPNPDNPVQPLLKWGGVKDADFVDFKVYRATSPITSVAALTPIATITSPTDQEFIDDGSDPLGPLLENTVYYYMVIAEDGHNVLDDATKSNNVSFKRPDCIPFLFSDPFNVGDSVIVTTSTSVPCKRAYIEWGDAVGGYWMEYETEKTAFVFTHRYSSTGSKVIKVRLESSAGFWSDLDTVGTQTVSDITPEAVLIVRPLEVVTGESVRCIGSKSQPVASNALISQYDYWVNGAWQLNKGPVFEIVPTSSQEILLRIFTDTGKSYTQAVGEGESIVVISGEPTDLTFSKDTTVNSRDESRDSDAEIIGIMDGVGEVELPMNIKNRQYTINGTSGLDDFKSDIDKIRSRQESQEYTRINVYDEKEGVTVRLDGRITGYKITQTTSTYVTWSFGFRVFNRTESP